MLGAKAGAVEGCWCGATAEDEGTEWQGNLVDQAALKHREVQLTASFQQEVLDPRGTGACARPRPGQHDPTRRKQQPRSGRTGPRPRAGRAACVRWCNTNFSVSASSRKKFMPARFSGKIEGRPTDVPRMGRRPLDVGRGVGDFRVARMIRGGSSALSAAGAAADQHAIGQGARKLLPFGHGLRSSPKLILPPSIVASLPSAGLGDVQGHKRPSDRGGDARLGHGASPPRVTPVLIIAGERTEIRADVVIVFVLLLA